MILHELSFNINFDEMNLAKITGRASDEIYNIFYKSLF